MMIRYETSIKVRYYECDPMGIVHHSNYLRYFECARDEMIESWGYGVEQCQADGITFPHSRDRGASACETCCETAGSEPERRALL